MVYLCVCKRRKRKKKILFLKIVTKSLNNLILAASSRDTKNAKRGTDRQTDTHTHTDGHCDLETESPHWADSVKIISMIL